MATDPPVAAGTGYAKGIARREQILDRAIEVFARRGSARTSLRAIAREVGVTHAALIHHFGSLEALLVAVCERYERRLVDAAIDDEPPTPVAVMLASARSTRAVPGLVQMYTALVAIAIQAGHPVATEFIAARFDALRAQLADRVRVLQREGRMRDDVDPTAVASLVIAASDGLQTQWLLDPAVPQEGALELLETVLAGTGSLGSGRA